MCVFGLVCKCKHDVIQCMYSHIPVSMWAMCTSTRLAVVDLGWTNRLGAIVNLIDRPFLHKDSPGFSMYLIPIVL